MSYLGPDAMQDVPAAGDPDPKPLTATEAIRQALNPRKPRSEVNIIESGPKAGALIALAAYLVGVLTVAIYLRNQDVPTPDLTALKAQYIYTGLEVVLLVVFAGIPALMLLGFVGQRSNLKAGEKRGFVLLASPFVVSSAVAVWAVLLFILKGACDFSTGHAVWVSAELVGLGAAACLLVVLAAQEVRDHHNAISFLWSSGALVLVVVLATVYSHVVYDELPGQYGGGQPKQTRLLFTKDGAEDAKDIGVVFQPGSQLSRPMEMILDGDDFYAVSLNNGQTAQIAKSTVVGLQEDTRAPHAVQVETVNPKNHRVGYPEAGDLLILTFSEKMDSSSLIPDWTDDQSIHGSIVLQPVSQGTELLRFFDETGYTEWSHLGTVEIDSDLGVMLGTDPFPVSIRRDQAHVIVTLSASAQGPRITPSPHAMTWHPSTEATDTKGNRALQSTATESDPKHPDPDF